MIELTKVKINHHNGVIETRNKVFRLALDLHIHTNLATYLATIFSSLARNLLSKVNAIEIQLVFMKNTKHYYLHILIPATEEIYQNLKKDSIFHHVGFKEFDNKYFYLNLEVEIPDQTFMPNQDFIQTERERLIQQSSGEMLQEIRQKNIELNQALQDLKASSKLIQTEKMRALGSMTAGVAHELNNPMMGILNFVQYAIKHTDENDRRYKPLVDTEREVKRCQDIITNLLTFSRMKAEGEEEFSQIKLTVLLERILKLQAYKIRGNDINIITHYPDNEQPVRVKINKIQQVILNLVTNAVDAMKDCEKRNLDLTVAANNIETIISVKDSGSGMDEEMMDKIFEPFFTTKQTGQGTGLGLAVSKSIIEEHTGTLICQSAPGEGTIFTITLPLCIELDQKQTREN